MKLGMKSLNFNVGTILRTLTFVGKMGHSENKATVGRRFFTYSKKASDPPLSHQPFVLSVKYSSRKNAPMVSPLKVSYILAGISARVRPV